MSHFWITHALLACGSSHGICVQKPHNCEICRRPLFGLSTFAFWIVMQSAAKFVLCFKRQKKQTEAIEDDYHLKADHLVGR